MARFGRLKLEIDCARHIACESIPRTGALHAVTLSWGRALVFLRSKLQTND
jgi:hypothetical protein